MKSKSIKDILYSIAALVAVVSIGFTSMASSVAGVVALSSTSAEVVEANSYSTFAGVSLTVNNMLATATANAIAVTDVEENETIVVAAAEEEESEEETETITLGVCQVNSTLYIRDAASTDGEIVGKIYNNCVATILSEEDGWYYVTSGNATGYVSADYMVVGDEDLISEVSTRLATVTCTTLYVRNDASTDASVLGMVPLGDDLVVVDEDTAEEGWIHVEYSGTTGYVSADYVTLSTEYEEAETLEEEKARVAKEEAARKAAAAASSSSSSSSSSSTKTYAAASGSGGSAVVTYACQFVGNPYKYGGTSLTNGCDCSGFVMSVYAAFGISLPHSSKSMRSVGYEVSTSDMQPGDIVCYSGHVGIYIGNDTIVNAIGTGKGIGYTNVYYSKIICVRRIY